MKELEEFKQAMEKTMLENAYKGSSWKDESETYMARKLLEEVAEYLILTFPYNESPTMLIRDFANEVICARNNHVTSKESELVDIANVCMMGWNRLKIEKEGKKNFDEENGPCLNCFFLESTASENPCFTCLLHPYIGYVPKSQPTDESCFPLKKGVGTQECDCEWE